jgi:hypothetical protein
MVVVRCAPYVRTYRGPQSRWFQAAQKTSRGRVRAGTIACDVLLVPAPGPGYHAKYANSSDFVAVSGNRRSRSLTNSPRLRQFLASKSTAFPGA